MEKYGCLLFIGDPHARSRRVNRRKEPYGEDVLNKLRYAAKLSWLMKAKVVITGDLLHDGVEGDVKYLTRLLRVLKGFYGGAVSCLEGNHDREGLELDLDGSMGILQEGGGIQIKRWGMEDVVEVGAEVVRLVYVPHGVKLPKVVSPRVGAIKGERVWMVTHHDLEVGSRYPGCVELFEVGGVERVINGHIHTTHRPKVLGGTEWFNIGNIEPLTVDVRMHCPNVWVWPKVGDGVLGGLGDIDAREVGVKWEGSEELTRAKWEGMRGLYGLTPVLLPHDFDCFDLTGLRVEASDGGVDEYLGVGSVQEVEVVSGFARDLRGGVGGGDLLLAKSADGVYLKEELEGVLQLLGHGQAGDWDEVGELMLALMKSST